MNKLVEYLLEHHNPGGNAITHIRVDDLLKEIEWTREEVFLLALEASDAYILTLSMKTGYRVRDNNPEGLELIGVWNKVYRKKAAGTLNLQT